MIFVCVVILTVHSNGQPYMKRRANLAESLYLLVLCTLAVMQIVEHKDAQYFVCLVLLIIAFVHTLIIFLYKAVRFFRQRFGHCACFLKTVMDRRSYEELENTQTDSNLDIDAQRQRRILDSIFSTSEESEQGKILQNNYLLFSSVNHLSSRSCYRGTIRVLQNNICYPTSVDLPSWFPDHKFDKCFLMSSISMFLNLFLNLEG